ncbi:MAG: YlxR family protein [Thermodesulfobacteriota bacterium]
MMALRADGPIRTCLGCGCKKLKFDLVRLAVDSEGRAAWDPKCVRPGRGVYICPDDDCLAAALKRRRFNRGFRRPVKTDLLRCPPWRENGNTSSPADHRLGDT